MINIEHVFCLFNNHPKYIYTALISTVLALIKRIRKEFSEYDFTCTRIMLPSWVSIRENTDNITASRNPLTRYNFHNKFIPNHVRYRRQRYFYSKYVQSTYYCFGGNFQGGLIAPSILICLMILRVPETLMKLSYWFKAKKCKNHFNFFYKSLLSNLGKHATVLLKAKPSYYPELSLTIQWYSLLTGTLHSANTNEVMPPLWREAHINKLPKKRLLVAKEKQRDPQPLTWHLGRQGKGIFI